MVILLYLLFVEFQITGPLQLQVYKAIAPYKSLGKGQISLQIDDQVDVIDKNANGKCYKCISYTIMYHTMKNVYIRCTWSIRLEWSDIR